MQRYLWIAGFVLLARLKALRSLGRRAWRKLGGRPSGDPAAALPRAVPRTVWLYWDKGEAAAPPLVRACITSWREQNPTWRVEVLDRAAAAAIVAGPDDGGTMSVQAYSDLLRLRLLERHGGVWADATVYCLQPLDHWLPPLTRHGFFAFVWTETDSWLLWPNMRRLVTSWFLAAAPGHPLVTDWAGHSFAYWQGRSRPHDYYWVHLIFEYLVRTDRGFRREWERMPKLGAVGPHLVHDHVRNPRDAEAVRAALRSGAVPVQKLRWNWPEADLARAREVLDALPAPETAPGAAPDTAPAARAV